MRIRGFKMKKN